MNIWISSQELTFVKALQLYLQYEIGAETTKVDGNIFFSEQEKSILSNPHLSLWILECDYDFWTENYAKIYDLVSGTSTQNLLLIASKLTPNFVQEILEIGIKGVYNKHYGFTRITDALEAIPKGDAYLTPDVATMLISYTSRKRPSYLTTREYQILVQLANGSSYKLIASSLNITIHTVRQHVRNLYQKLKVNSKAEAIRKYYQGTLEA